MPLIKWHGNQIIQGRAVSLETQVFTCLVNDIVPKRHNYSINGGNMVKMQNIGAQGHNGTALLANKNLSLYQERTHLVGGNSVKNVLVSFVNRMREFAPVEKLSSFVKMIKSLTRASSPLKCILRSERNLEICHSVAKNSGWVSSEILYHNCL